MIMMEDTQECAECNHQITLGNPRMRGVRGERSLGPSRTADFIDDASYFNVSQYI